MTMRLLAAALLVAALFAGCATTPAATETTQPGTTKAPLLAGPALWNDPQDAPNPKWGWATLSNPPDLNRTDIPRWWLPFNATALPSHIAGMQHVAQAKLPSGAGIAVFGSVAVVPEDSEFIHFLDVSNPTQPVELGKVESGGRGAAIIAYPDGRLVTAVATSPGFDVIDFTDPTNPFVLNQTHPSEGGHKLGIVPGTPILYNAASDGANNLPGLNQLPCDGPAAATCQAKGYTSIYNLTDPAHPKLVQEFQNGYSCHHIFFWESATKHRAICAGMEVTQIWDTTDPEHPTVVVDVPMQLGNRNLPSTADTTLITSFSHSAGLSADGTVLYVGDESGGGGSPPGCFAGTQTPAGNSGTPVGATWFYDLTNEQDPQLLGYFSPPRDTEHNAQRSCTTHHGRLVPDPEGRDLLAMSYYQDGVILIDFTGIKAGTLPQMVDEFADGSDTWETWYAGGYLFTGDLARGFDVLKFR